MDEATALLITIESTAPDAPTTCSGWNAHDLVAHLAAGAAEMADLAEAAIAQRPEQTTKPHAEREAPYVALDDDVLRERLVHEALRLNAAVDGLTSARNDVGVLFAGRRVTADEIVLHGRSEAALHRFDLAGFDVASRELLAQPELTVHGVAVLNSMPSASREFVARRVASAGVRNARFAFASPGGPDVVLVVDADGARFELDDPRPAPVLCAGTAARLLALWGRRVSTDELRWAEDNDAAGRLAAVLWGEPRGVRLPPT